jgi:hypothetical protein
MAVSAGSIASVRVNCGGLKTMRLDRRGHSGYSAPAVSCCNHKQRDSNRAATRVAAQEWLAARTNHRSPRYNIKRPHHLVIFMLQDVAMPNVASRETLEANNDARHHSRIGGHSVFPA